MACPVQRQADKADNCKTRRFVHPWDAADVHPEQASQKCRRQEQCGGDREHQIGPGLPEFLDPLDALIDDERAFADEFAEESFGAYIARSVGSWARQQPANLRAVTPLLRWPNDRILSWNTWRGLASNAIVVLFGMVALTVFLGVADGVLLALRRLVTARATVGACA